MVEKKNDNKNKNGETSVYYLLKNYYIVMILLLFIYFFINANGRLSSYFLFPSSVRLWRIQSQLHYQGTGFTLLPSNGNAIYLMFMRYYFIAILRFAFSVEIKI